jgi:uncharacterized membrane protein YgcG
MSRYILTAVLGWALFALSEPVLAQERILSYHSDIHISDDASMVVTETIRVVAQGNQIRRGIYREFPTTYKDRLGNKVVVHFDVLGVTRNGRPEPWHINNRSNGVRIYAGDADTLLNPGEYTYTFTYETNRQIGFFDDHNELYWNVTGNGWDFVIEQASATVSLPGSVSASDIAMDGYTGSQGATGRDYTRSVEPGTGFIATRHALSPREGLTLVMRWPVGVIQKPDTTQKFIYLLKDNLGLVLSISAFTGSVLYLFVIWYRVGRDPQPGVVFPHYEPPTGYSPASARYIRKMGYDDKTFSSAIINLAVKGHVLITQDDDDYTLQRESSSQKLAAGEAALIDKLFSSSSVIVLEKANHQRISVARIAHKKALRRDYLNRYFKTNAQLLLPSTLFSVVLIIAIFFYNAFVPIVVIFIVANVLLHFLFGWLLKAPSSHGRLLLDKLDGFKMYLEVAEKDDLNLRNPPQLTPQLFEQYLPFAIALDVEQRWAEKFSEIFAHLEAEEGGSFKPSWYSGNVTAAGLGSFTKDVSNNLSSAISSAASPPGSSSSGGGGFSGGGGGGGGGGGW